MSKTDEQIEGNLARGSKKARAESQTPIRQMRGEFYCGAHKGELGY